MITRLLAVTLSPGTTLHHTTLRNADGTPLRARVNGKCKVWVTRPDEFSLPVKHGLRDYFYITPLNAHKWTTTPGASQ